MEKFSKVLIADDEPDILASYKEALEIANHKVINFQYVCKCYTALKL